MHALSIAATPWRRTRRTSMRRIRARDWRAQGYLSPRAAQLRRQMKQRVHRATRRRTRAILRGAMYQHQHQKGCTPCQP